VLLHILGVSSAVTKLIQTLEAAYGWASKGEKKKKKKKLTPPCVSCFTEWSQLIEKTCLLAWVLPPTSSDSPQLWFVLPGALSTLGRPESYFVSGGSQPVFAFAFC
jgi:hypothetical protein